MYTQELATELLDIYKAKMDVCLCVCVYVQANCSVRYNGYSCYLYNSILYYIMIPRMYRYVL